ncbi:MAG TPA: hypothetical protein VKV34_05355 [Thermoleophilia bacterium]|nr:hypothetical protein [Thermoleophilia bacterium]
MAGRIRRATFAICTGVVTLWMVTLLLGLLTRTGVMIDLAFGPLLAAVPVAAIGAMVCVPWRARSPRSRGTWVVSGGGERTPPGEARPPADRHR